MFTSRAEFRILLRQDNADLRLTEKGHRIGLASDDRLEKMMDKRLETKEVIQLLKSTKIEPNIANDRLEEHNTATIKEKISAHKLLKRPQIHIASLGEMDENLRSQLSKYAIEILEQAEIQIKYETYIEKEEKLVAKISGLENHKIPNKINYEQVKALSAEAVEKLNKVRPETIGQASRISGVSPADISIIMVYLGK